MLSDNESTWLHVLCYTNPPVIKLCHTCMLSELGRAEVEIHAVAHKSSNPVSWGKGLRGGALSMK